jgi:hypothetical protein
MLGDAGIYVAMQAHSRCFTVNEHDFSISCHVCYDFRDAPDADRQFLILGMIICRGKLHYHPFQKTRNVKNALNTNQHQFGTTPI